MSINNDKQFIGNQSVQSGMYDLCIALKNNIMRSVNVSSLAIVKKIDLQKEVALVELFPLVTNEATKQVECITVLTKLNDNYVSLLSELSINDIVLVVFLDRNSRQSFMQLKKQQKATALTENNLLHSDTYGIITNICFKA